EPAAGPQELLDEKEREPVRVPVMSAIDEAEVELRIAAIAGRAPPDKVHELRCVRPRRAHDASQVSDASGLEERRHRWRGVAVDRGQRASAVQAESGGEPAGGAAVASAQL